MMKSKVNAAGAYGNGPFAGSAKRPGSRMMNKQNGSSQNVSALNRR
jgi:hypothetical protein